MTGPHGIYFATRRRLRDGDGEQGTAILLVLVAIMVAGSLSIVLLGALLAQTRPVQLARKSEQTVNAAQAGFDALLSQIRASLGPGSKPGTTVGDPTKLPCWTPSHPLTGSVEGAPGDIGYVSYATYYEEDPRGRTQSWLDDVSNQLTCTAGASPNDISTAPSYAVMTSTGTGAAVPGRAATSGDRTLTTVYLFKTNNVNIPGGPIHNFSLPFTYCWDAKYDHDPRVPVPPNPAEDSVWNVALQSCVSGAAQQGFQYRDDWSISLAITTTTDTDGYCLTAPPTKGAPATMELCDHDNAAGLRARQKWGVDDSDRINNKIGGVRVCLSPQGNALAYGAVLITTDCNQGQGGYQSWSAEPQVGAGHAGEGSFQLVNFAYFGQCFDITDWNWQKVNMILYPCKQETDGSLAGWNQRVMYDAANKWIYVQADSTAGGAVVGQKYCAVGPTQPDVYVTMAKCDTSKADQKWVAGDRAIRRTGYTYVSSSGYCLDSKAGNPATYPQWRAITTYACSGALSQKWNAPPTATDSGTDNTRETTGSG